MECKVFIRIRDKKTGLVSKDVHLTKIIFEQIDVEFEFIDPNSGEHSTLPYMDFLFYQDDYEVIIRICDEEGN